MDGLSWRPMTEADLDGVAAVAAGAFPDHPEERACFANRLTLHPAGCKVLVDAAGGVAGYLAAYPWRMDDAPALNTLLPGLPEAPGAFYLHDLALSPFARGGGHAAAGVALAAQAARDAGLSRVSLVAVNDAAAFWMRQGFAPRRSPALDAKLAGYGAEATYMVRSL